MDSVDGARFNNSGSDQTLSNLCDSCKYHGKQKEASHFCQTCHEKLCKSCKGWHKGFKATRNHKIIPLKDKEKDTTPTVNVMCVCDQNLEAIFYCEWHADVICQACRNLKHKDCETISVKEKSIGYDKRKLHSLLRRAETLSQKTGEFIAKRRPELAAQEGVKIDCKIHIQAFYQEVESMLDNLRKDANDELEKSAAKHKESLENNLSVCDTTVEILKSEIDLLKEAMKTNEKGIQFAADIKVSNRLKQLEASMENVLCQGETAQITFKRNADLVEKLRKTRLGTISVGCNENLKACITDRPFERQTDAHVPFGSHGHRKKIESFLGLEIESANHVEIKRSALEKVSSISGCAFLPSGDAVLCDMNNSDVTILTSTFSYRERIKLSSAPFDVSVLSKTSVVVTCPDSKQLRYIDVFPKLISRKTIQLDKKCWGIAICNDEIFVACHNEKLIGNRDGEIRIFGLNGNHKRTFGLNDDGSYTFCWPFYICVNVSSGRVFVSDAWTGKVTCVRSSFPPRGNELVTYSSRQDYMFSNYNSSHENVYDFSADDLNKIRGICVDEKDNVMVCGRGTDNGKIIRANGTLHCTLLTHRDGIKSPLCVAYRQSDNMLMIGCSLTNYLYAKSLDM